MLQRVEGAAVEQAGFDIVELPFDFALRLRPAHAAGLRPEAVVGGEGQELGVVEGAVGVVTQHHGLEVVVQADAGDAAQMMEGVHVFAQGRRQVHRLDEAQVLPPRVAEQVAEQVDAPAAFAREVDVVDAIVHLCLHALARSRSAARAAARRRGRNSRNALTHARCSSPVKPRALQFLQGALDGEVRILGEQFLQDRLEGIDDAADVAAACGDGAAWPSRWACTRAKRAPHGAARDAQFVGNRPYATSRLMPLHDLVTHRFVHDGPLPLARSGPSTNSATTLA